jgi:hypothetical protein
MLAHDHSPDTLRLKSIISSLKMRCFPAFYVVVKWPPQRVFIIPCVMGHGLYMLEYPFLSNFFFLEKIDKNSLIFRKIYDKFDKFDKNEKKSFTALVYYQSSEITTKLLIDNCDIYFEKLLIDNLDTYLKF